MEEVDLLIRAGSMLSMTDDSVVDDALVAVRGNRIVYAGPAADAAYTSQTTIGTPDSVVMPGLVNGHTHVGIHFYGTLCDDANVLGALYEIIIPMEHGYDDELMYAASSLGFWDAVRGGVTTVCDLFHLPEATAQAAKRLGVRGLIANKIIEFKLDEHPFELDRDSGTYRVREYDRREAERRLEDNVRFVERWKGDALVNPILGPHAPDTLSSELLVECARAADALDVKMHIHVAQSASEIATVRRKGYEGSIRYLADIGFLSPRVHAAHLWFVDEEEIGIGADHGMSMSFNPVIAIACRQFAPIEKIMASGMTVAMGTDCLSMDQLEDMRASLYVANYLRGSETFMLNAKDLLQMATIGGARALGLEDEIGTIEAGKKADLIVLDLRDAQLVPNTNTFETVAYYAKARNLSHSVIDGKIVYADGRLCGADQDEIFDEGRRLAREYLRRGRNTLEQTGLLERIEQRFWEQNLGGEPVARGGARVGAT